jgi:hypothetical protein
MRRRARHAIALVPLAVLALAAGACTTGAPPGSAKATSPTRPPQSVPSLKPAPATTAPVTGEVPPDVMTAARAVLVEAVGADAAATATVVQAEAVNWPDGSLGCPEPDMMYTQVITPGYQVVFEVDGQRYDIRATETGHAKLCTSGRPLSG